MPKDNFKPSRPLSGAFHLLLCLLLLCIFFAVPGQAATDSWDDENGNIFANPQNERTYNSIRSNPFLPEQGVKPLPHAKQVAEPEPMLLHWSLRLLSTHSQNSGTQHAQATAEQQLGAGEQAAATGESASDIPPIPGAVFEDAFGPVLVLPNPASEALANAVITPTRYPDWLAGNPLWLFVNVKTNIEGSYFYAPFAIGQSNSERAKTAGAVLPTTLEILGDDGKPVPGVHFYFPSGKLKQDPFSGLRLPVYTDEVLVLAQIPANLLGSSLHLKVNALICTEASCTPFRKVFTLPLDKAALSTDPIEAALGVALMDYQTAPFDHPALKAADTAKAAAPPQFAGGADASGSSAQGSHDAAAKTGLADYLAGLDPQYYVESLEVTNIWRAVLLGLLAGLILNFMPCVLPVITLKLGTLIGLGGWNGLANNGEMARRNRRRFRVYSLCFTLGVFVWFGILFGVIGFAGLIWGQFFQSQPLILGLTMLLFIMALSMFGLVRIPLINIQVDSKSALPWQAFFGGMLATLLATPCSGPLLGGVLGWAVNQSIPYLGVTLLSVAVGMASPFILMTISPGLARLLPKPGPWTKTLETIMGFILLGTVLYLLSMVPDSKLFIVLAALLVLAFAAWLWSRPIAKGKSRLSLGRVLAAVLLVCAVYFPFTYRSMDTSWKNFELATFSQYAGKSNILLDFTADWCINCRAMEMTTLTEQRLQRWAKAYNLIYIKVDLTGDNPYGQALLESMGSASIPLLAIIPADNPQRPTVLRDLVTPGQLDNALKQALGK